ncbi:MAG TPA: DsbA family protein [Nocardioidaceae bacterium]|nr:DsbA family protein [Nocardioidaceae bacterium]
MRADEIVLYVDFTCPWSYLATLRAERLRAAGLHVEWRAVEHAPRRPGNPVSTPTRFDRIRRDTERVLGTLLPGEPFPYSLAGFVPYTRPAVAGYAEAYVAGVAPYVARQLFDAYWLNALALGDPKLVRTLLVEAIRSGRSSSEQGRLWGYAVDVTGAPITAAADRLVRRWRSEWAAMTRVGVPVLVVDGGAPLVGDAAVAWLGDEVLGRGLDPLADVRPEPPAPGRRVDAPTVHWATYEGHRWVRAYQDRFSLRRPA